MKTHHNFFSKKKPFPEQKKPSTQKKHKISCKKITKSPAKKTHKTLNEDKPHFFF